MSDHLLTNLSVAYLGERSYLSPPSTLMGFGPEGIPVIKGPPPAVLEEFETVLDAYAKALLGPPPEVEREFAASLEAAFKSNPNHDELGRFASGDGGGGAVGRTSLYVNTPFPSGASSPIESPLSLVVST